ncbi:branched-chain amino acid ABC transporter permease [Rudaeicoccus suwonensis]|uniref:Branched-chain amino acid transport system permease protein n=1 Tax=Rudaeicoccus suwonensis TaxID=657409 RepID=A0A561DWX5_9MICO|nr:branched-chain amino acid ABC transporter permease [Rudaeicoccus suwonensis]TWE07878.1 branched-chain amino acid transport system permease protein [Rudaeicoccus suwonensis]
MSTFLTYLISGVTAGSIYAMMALALVVVFRSSSTINFAQGEFALFCSFVAWWLTTKGWSMIAAVFVAMAVGFVMGVLTERFLVRPVRRRNEVATLIIGIGLFTALNGADGWIWGPANKTFPELLPSGAGDYFSVGGARLHYDSIGIFLSLLLVVGILMLLFQRTPLGLQMRAVATNPESAALSGVKVGRVLSVSWGISAAIGAFAGVLLIPVLPPNQLSLSSFFNILIMASAAALFGGLDSVTGAVVGGLALGVGESMLSGYVTFLGGSLQLTIALLIIVLVLVFKPTGIFGAQRIERV